MTNNNNFGAMPLGADEIDLSKLDMKLMRYLTLATSRTDFNNASYHVLISTHKPVNPGAYNDQDNKPLPGVTVEGSAPAVFFRASVTVEALKPLSRDPNVKFIHNENKLKLVP